MKSQRCRRFHTASSVLFLVVSLLFGALQVALGEAESDADHQKRLESHKELFRFHPDVQVIGPTTFPRPTDFRSRDDKSQQRDTDTTQAKLVPHMKPVLGKHRADRDAVFALAAELDLRYYMIFVQSLRRTGFDGDIVLSVSPLDLKNEQVYDFFSSDPGIVVYVPTLSCFNFEGEEVDSVKGGMRLCKVPHLYARQEIDGSITPVDDPRPARTVAVTRYEIYWLMLLNYNTDRWMLLVDSRDTYFQSNPFAAVPRKTDPTGNSGLLYFYGENAESTRIGLSKMNSKWLTNAYGEFVANSLKDKPIICSGATMGEQVALETYLRAMVAESDDTQVVIVGADQGFHNFLYYSHKLRNANAIHSIVVFDQGTGIVNNMGAMRTKDLKEWGNGKIYEETDEPNGKKGVRVLNWDGSVSPVVHQYDRHHVLSSFLLRRRGAEFEQEFKAKKAAAKTM